MICGHINNLEQDKPTLAQSLVKGLEYLKNTDFSKLEPGKYEIEGSTIYALVQHNQTAPKLERKVEAHRKYIDIQYLSSGEEIIGFALSNPANEVSEDLLEQKDAIFFKTAKDETDLVLTKGMYAILFPTDLHRPGCTYHNSLAVTKVVVKVAVSSI